MEKIVVVGSSGHAKVIIDVIEKEQKYEIAGLIDSFEKVLKEILGYKVLGKEDDLPHLIKTHRIDGGIIAIGDNFIRSIMADKILRVVPEFNFITTIHPNACIGKNVSISDGTAIMAGAILNPNCSVGKFCYLNTHSSIDHDTIMGDYSALEPHASTGGNVSIGDFTAICMGATVIQKVKIGEHCVIGAGATVLKNIDSYTLAYGTPAKIIRQRKAGDKFIN